MVKTTEFGRGVGFGNRQCLEDCSRLRNPMRVGGNSFVLFPILLLFFSFSALSFLSVFLHCTAIPLSVARSPPFIRAAVIDRLNNSGLIFGFFFYYRFPGFLITDFF